MEMRTSKTKCADKRDSVRFQETHLGEWKQWKDALADAKCTEYLPHIKLAERRIATMEKAIPKLKANAS